MRRARSADDDGVDSQHYAGNRLNESLPRPAVTAQNVIHLIAAMLAAMASQQTTMERTRGKAVWSVRGRVLRGASAVVARSYLHRPDPGHGQCDRQTDNASEDDLGDLAQPVL